MFSWKTGIGLVTTIYYSFKAIVHSGDKANTSFPQNRLMITEYSLFHLEITYIMFGNLREIFGISNSNIFAFCAVSAVSERTDRGQ